MSSLWAALVAAGRLGRQCPHEADRAVPFKGLAHDGLLTAIADGRDEAEWSGLARGTQERTGLH